MEQRYISGEEYQQQLQPSKPPHIGMSPLIWIVIAVVVIGAGSFGVVAYLHHTSHTGGTPITQQGSYGSSSGNTPPAGGNVSTGGPSTSSGPACSGSGPCLNSSGGSNSAPIPGTVTAVSATSITIQPIPSGSPETFAVTSSTKESNGDPSQGTSPYDYKGIRVGESVGIVTDSSNTSQAQIVELNFQTKAQ